MPKSIDSSDQFPFNDLPWMLKESCHSWCHLEESLQFLRLSHSLRHFLLRFGPFTRRLDEFRLDFERNAFEEGQIYGRRVEITLRSVDFHGDPLAFLGDDLDSVERRNGYRLLVSMIRFCQKITVYNRDHECYLRAGRPVNLDLDSRLIDMIPAIRCVREIHLRASYGLFLSECSSLFEKLSIDKAHLALRPRSYENLFDHPGFGGLRVFVSRTLVRSGCQEFTIYTTVAQEDFMNIFHAHPMPQVRFEAPLFGYLRFTVQLFLRMERERGAPIESTQFDFLITIPLDQYKRSHAVYEFRHLSSERYFGNLQRHDWAELTDSIPEEVAARIALHEPIDELPTRIWEPRFSWGQARRRLYIFQAYFDKTVNAICYSFRPELVHADI